MRLSRRLFTLVFASVALFFTVTASAAEPVSKSRLGGVAIGGHDSVAYHQIERDPQQSAIGGVKPTPSSTKALNGDLLQKRAVNYLPPTRINTHRSTTVIVPMP